MGFVTTLGKLLIIASIAFQAYLFFADRQAISTFDKELNKALSACNCLTPEIQALVKQYLRFVVVGLLGSSVLLLIRCWLLKLPTLLGLGLLLWVEHHQVFRTVPTLALLENTALWHSLGLLGVVIYLLGAECTSCKEDKSGKGECSKEKAETKEEPKEKAGKGRKR
jgi:hypothetical protein